MNEDNEIYGSFAYVYDKFMDNVPYEKWSEYVQSLLKEYGIEEGLVLDLGLTVSRIWAIAIIVLTCAFSLWKCPRE